MIRVGVDAGGTFTDFVAEGDGWYRELKRPSRPADPAAVVLEALPELLPRKDARIELVFSTTAATNALLERRGGPTLLLTTRGFEDVLEIGRQTRPQLYALEPRRVPPLCPREDRLGVEERVAVTGEILQPLGEAELARLIAEAQARPGATIAICLLHAYAAPEHERRLAERLRALGRRVSVSSEVCPLPREYERSSTTVVDAYVTPVLGATLARLASPRIALRVMESSGGARTAGAGRGPRPARTVLSGPAAGVIAIEALARELALPRVIALDIGGTSTDVALVRDGAVARVDELLIEGLPIALPSVGVSSVGAGGGSIAWVDAGGALKVGPRSAGALPGPAAYGRGGLEPTVTDAHVVLGRLRGHLLSGALELDLARAQAAVDTIAQPLGVSLEAAAQAILAVADATIVRAVRAVSLGEDPRGLTLVAYGGASGLHAVAVARSLGLAEVIVPLAPGLQCALGALRAEVVVEELLSWRERLDLQLSAAARTRLAALTHIVDEELGAEGVAPASRVITASVRARYEGQGIDGELELAAEGLAREVFEAAHQRAYGHRLERAVEVVRLSVRGSGRAPTHASSARLVAVGWPRVGSRVVEGEPTRIYRRDRLRSGTVIEGPALIVELSATFYLPAGARAEVDTARRLRVTP